MNILDEIVEKRKADIARLGYTFGVEIPRERNRKIVPFVSEKGAILEIKRASPSKGDIAPNLDSVETAKAYIKAGAKAISVLTEQNYFKGSLKDLIAVSKLTELIENPSTGSGTGKSVAVLRKDFLIDEEEIDIAYRCGADAVLLIARILDDEKLVSMAKKCETLGITAFIELRTEDDLRKLIKVSEKVAKNTVVCGVNSRDLADFKIDLLTPAGVLGEIKRILGDDAKVVFESGIRTPESANFAGGLGFAGMLLGEAAARNPLDAKNLVSSFVDGKETANCRAWGEFARKAREKVASMVRQGSPTEGAKAKPFVKICGITSEKDAEFALEKGADFLGFIFWKKSPRNVGANIEVVKKIAEMKKTRFKDRKLVGVIVNMEDEESRAAIELSKSGVLDFLQLHAFSDCDRSAFFADESLMSIPHYFAVNVSSEDDLEKLDFLRKMGEPRILVDAKVGEQIGGTGVQVESGLVDKVREKNKLWLAGGISSENVSEIVLRAKPELIDVSSSLESMPGIKDLGKVARLFEAVRN